VSDFACNLQGAKRLLVPALSYGLARLPQLGLPLLGLPQLGLPQLGLLQLGLLNTTARAASPPLFSSTYIHHIKRATSALLASCYHPCCLHQPHRHPHLYRNRRVSFDVIDAAGIVVSSTSYSSRRIVQLPSVPVRASLTIHEARSSSRRVIFAIVLAAGSLTAILIDILLIASRHII